ncbi:MAG: hypothetical protein R1F52_06510 [Candidatus Nitrosoabyssus spongiisocia]|nr:MAG: hypothetical protein R1F52_06510 [Nitrosopumilaceae archaeon AB1(1)]
MDDPQLIFMELFVGSPGIEIKYNKNDHKIDSRMINMKDSIYDKTMNVDVLSGIIVVSRVYLDNQIKINGNIFSNPHAIIPLDEKIIENIQKIIFT